VSSVGQVETDYNPEGISLPAQSTAIRARARELGAAVVEEFTDPGKSGKSIEKREAFREMIAYLRQHPNVGYVIVYALSRFARNRYDDAIMMMTLEKLGVTLISATERTLDDSPSGRAMHGMLAVFNEYQVLVSGEDIRYKMGQKAKNGGTLGIAKVGYRNVRITFEGREVRTVEVDPDQAQYVRLAFELYASGNYGFRELRDALTDAGYRTRATRRFPPGPISIHSLGNMLRDRYYLGYVTYQDVEYPGRHEPLIEPDLFDRVQRILDVERGGGTRERIHDHYLKGTIWCARCRCRLILRPSTGKSGHRYFYFICRGNQDHSCDLPSLPVEKVERAVADHYDLITVTADHRERLESLADEAVNDAQQSANRLRKSVCSQLAELDRQEDRFLDLIGDPEWPQEKLKARLRKIQADKQRAERQLDNTEDDLTPGRDALHAALALLDRPCDLYTTAPDEARRKLNKALFNRLYVDAADHDPTTTQDSLNEPYASLVHADRATSHDGEHRTAEPVEGETKRLSGLLTTALSGGCASKETMVEVPGIEPGSFVASQGLLRAQPAVPLLGSTGHAGEPV